MMKEMHRVAPLGEANNKDVAVNTLLLRNYNDGRTGGWDNYCCYKGKNKGSYISETVHNQDQAEQGEWLNSNFMDY